MINDMKEASVPDDVGMGFAGIEDRKTYDGYGKRDAAQIGEAMAGNKELRDKLASTLKRAAVMATADVGKDSSCSGEQVSASDGDGDADTTMTA